MTQIAATTAAAIGGKAGHAAKGHGAHKGAGADFAAVVAGLGQTTGEGETADTNALPLTGEDAGAGTDAGSDAEGDKAGQPVVMDLALGSAAQSAVADMVVAAQAPAQIVPGQSSQTGVSDTAIALDGKAAVRPSWHMPMAVSAPPAAVPGDKVAAAEALPDAAIVADPGTAVAQPAADGAAFPQEIIAPQVAAAVPQEIVAPQIAAAPPKSTVRTGIQTGAAFRQAVREAIQPAAHDSAAAAVEGPRTAPILASLPEAVRDTAMSVPAPSADAQTSAPIVSTATAEGESGQAAAEAIPAALVPNIAKPAAAPAQPSVPRMEPAPRDVAQDAVTTDIGSAATAAAGAPVMSALHRAVPASGEVLKSQHTATAMPSTAETPRNGTQTAQDQSGRQDKRQDTGQDKAATAIRGSDTQVASVSDSVVATGTQYSDILQSLPPIAQSRLGAVTDASPIVTGPGDVGATLQGQAIDMGVDGQWIDRMAQEITALAAGNGHSRFQLNPPNLGRIQIDVWQGENGGQVKLMTETDEAATRLREGKSGLEADARLASLSLNTITIERSSAGFDSGRDQAPQQNSQRHPQGSDQSSGQSNTQTGQNDGRSGGQAAQQASAQASGRDGSQGSAQGQQNSGGQGKSSSLRDVLNERAGTTVQDGGSVRRDGDRLVRYA